MDRRKIHIEPGNGDSLWSNFTYLISQMREQGNDYLNMWESIKENERHPLEGWWLGAKSAPAAKGNHHAREHGLIEHLLEMWNFWCDVPVPDTDLVNSESVWRGILLHDLHKAYKTFVLPRLGFWDVEYGDHYSDGLLNDELKSIWLAQQHGIRLSAMDMNVIVNSHGGYSKIRTKHQPMLAKMVYLLDEMSGNVVERGRMGTEFGPYWKTAQPVKTHFGDSE